MYRHKQSIIQTPFKLNTQCDMWPNKHTITFTKDTLTSHSMSQLRYDNPSHTCTHFKCPMFVSSYICKLKEDLWCFNEYVQNAPIFYFREYWFTEDDQLIIKGISSYQLIKDDTNDLLIDDIIELVYEYLK